MNENKIETKKPYKAPVLVSHGDIREITQGGTGQMTGDSHPPPNANTKSG
jgi:hypothetical protein